MAREFSVIVGIDAGPARRGAREFRAASTTVTTGSKQMSAGLKRTNRRAIALVTTIGRLRGVATLAFSGFLGVGGLTAVTRTIAGFEQGMKRVEALLGDRAVGGAIAKLTTQARELGATTAFTATQAAEGMQFLTLAGFDALQTFQAIGPALELAQAGMLDLGSAADIVSNIMQGFSVDASRTQEVVDALAFVATRTNTSIRQLGEAMKFVAPVAGNVGLQVEETAAALGVLGNSGLQASLAGTGLRRVISGLLGPTKEAQKVFQRLNLDTEELVEALGDPQKGLEYVIEQLAAKGLSAADAFTLFGQRGAPAILSLTSQTGTLSDLNEKMEDIEGTARTIGATLIDTLSGDARIAVSAFQDAIIELGEAGLREFLRDVLVGFTAFVRALSGAEQDLLTASEATRKWATAGEFLRNNLDNLRKAAVVFVAFLNRNLIIGVTTAIARFALLSTTVLGLAGPFAVASAGATLLTGALAALRAVAVTLGVGALLAVVGLLVDYAIFSDDAGTSTDKTTAAMRRQRSELEGLAFEFNILSDELKEIAVTKLAAQLDDDRRAIIGMTNALRNRSSAQARLAEDTTRQIELEKIIREEEERTGLSRKARRDGTDRLREAEAELALVQERVAQSNLLIQSGAFASEEALARLKQEVQRNELRMRAWNDVIAGNYETVEEAITAYNSAGDAVKNFAQQLKSETGLTIEQSEALEDLIKKYDSNSLAIAAMEENLTLARTALKNLNAETADGRIEQLNRVIEEMEAELKKLREQLSPTEKALQEVADAAQKVEDRLDPGQALIRAYANEVITLRAAFLAGELGFERFNELLRILGEELAKNRKKLQEACGDVEEFEGCQSESAKRMEQIWEQAMRNVQDAFADAFRGAFDSFEDFSDRLIGAFKDMISNMLAAWFTSGLQNLFTGQGFGAGGNAFPFANLFGGGGGAGAGAGGGAGGFAGLLGGLKNVGGALLGAAKAFTTGAGLFFNSGLTTSVFAGGGAAGAGALGAAGVTGLASGFATDQLLGSRGNQSTTNILSTIGGIIGGIFGGVPGALAGGAIGGFVSNLFGGAKKLERATVLFSASQEGLSAELEKVTSKQRSFFRGRKFSTTTEELDVTAFDEAFANVVDSLRATGERLGVDVNSALESFRFENEINIKGKSEEEISALLEDSFNDAVISVIGTLVDSVEGISERLKATVNTFRGNAEDFIAAFDAVVSIDLALALNPVETALESIKEANVSVTQSYRDLLGAYRTLVNEYDGSLEGLQFLAQATGILKQAQIELAAALIGAGEDISATFQSSAQSIREALLSEEELYSLRRNQIDDLVAQAQTTTDPAELRSLAEQINSLTNDAFGLLDESQQAELGQEFITFFEELDDLFGGQIQQGLDDVSEDSSAIDQEVADSLTAAAQAIIDANRDARDFWQDWRTWIREDRARGGSGGGGSFGGLSPDLLTELKELSP